MSTTGDLEGAHECLVDRHHPASVVKLPAVVGGREQGHLRKISFQFFNISFRQKFFCQNNFSNWFLFKSHQLTLSKELVTILHHLGQERFKTSMHYALLPLWRLNWHGWDLVSSAYEVKVVSVEELGDNVSSKCEADSAVILAPPLKIRKCGINWYRKLESEVLDFTVDSFDK